MNPADPATPGNTSRLATRLAIADRRLRALLALPAAPEATSPTALLEDAARSTEAAMATDPADTAGSQVTALVAESLRLQLDLRTALAAQREHTAVSLAASLRRLGSPTDGNGLAHQVCTELVGHTGFAVAAFSAVTGNRLSVLAVAGTDRLDVAPFDVDLDPHDAEAACLAAADPRPSLATRDRIAAPMAGVLDAEEYALATIVVGDAPVAILHVGRRDRLAVDDLDLGFVALYQTAVSAIVARQRWSDKAQRHQETIRAALSRIVEDAARVTRTDFEIGGDVVSPPRAQTLSRLPVNEALEQRLTTRETEVMRLIASGASNAEIADQLFIGVETVKSHVKKILRKIGAVNRSEAISLYVDRG
ncbi:LuxR family transcriptional regulator [Gordonia desulfuricans]|uniref:LuxR family transcriptional regulator n=1 Tax=Gordonia desulfuricans TaxID=89051 RepID=A0A7K3LLJ3_9ACTN|nr:helix-turn-helix transcriptional regulator [Gordonia desulfuricans]NDK89122.1 LuxR family transcriptional regulator [Gordonia desulfuricans]